MLSAQDHGRTYGSSHTSYDPKNDYPQRHSTDNSLEHNEGETSDDTKTTNDTGYTRFQQIHNAEERHRDAAGHSAQYQQQQSPRVSGFVIRQESPRLSSIDSFHDTFPRRIARRPSNDSLRSNMSTTSSIFSTASRISKLPNVVKSSLVSVKDFVIKSGSQRARHKDARHIQARLEPTVPTSLYHPTDRESFSTRLRRRTPSAMNLAGMFSRTPEDDMLDVDRSLGDLSLNASTSYSVLELKDGRANTSLVNTRQSRTTNTFSKRRNSMASDPAVRLLKKEETSPSRRVSVINEEKGEPHTLGFSDEIVRIMEQDGAGLDPVVGSSSSQSSAVGKLLFGEEIENMAFFDQELGEGSASSSMISFGNLDLVDQYSSDTKSDHIVTSKPSLQDIVWSRQRAKSCQDKVPSLRQLAQGQYPPPCSSNTTTLTHETANTNANATLSLTSTFTSTTAHTSTSSSTSSSTSTSTSTSTTPIPTSALTLSSTNNNNPEIVEAIPSRPRIDFFNPTLLVATTLTTLHSKLIHACDRTLASVVLAPVPSAGSRVSVIFPDEALQSIAVDLRKMSDMVEWDQYGPLSRKSVSSFFTVLDSQLADGRALSSTASTEHLKVRDRLKKEAEINQAVTKTVKEIVSSMKQMVNQCICQYHKIFEKAMVIPCKGYKIEGSNRFGIEPVVMETPYQDYDQSEVEHMDWDVCWFRSHFVGTDYSTFCGYMEDGEPVLITAVCDTQKDSEGADETGTPQRQYRVIIRTKQSPDTRKILPDSFLLNAPLDAGILETQGETMIHDTTWKGVIEMSFDVPFNRLGKIDAGVMQSSGIEEEVLKLDENSIHKRYKFGVLYVKEGQTKEEDWFSNQHDSDKFDRFLHIIGQRVELQGYTGWAAGLDTKSGDSGEHTYTDVWNDNVLAYHVSTLIPSKPGDKQQIQRKRHIGNDIVCIVFAEGRQPFNPAAIKSQFLHAFIVVHEEEWNGKIGWRVEVATVEDVPDFGPKLPDGGFFFEQSDLRSFILAKLINAEYAALKSPKFAQPMARAREGILSGIVERGCKVSYEPKMTTTGKHNKSPSTASDKSSRSSKSLKETFDLTPAPSRSSMIKDFSEGIAGLGRRRSTQELAETKPKQQKPKTRKTKGLKTEVMSSKRSRSELDLIHVPPQPSTSANLNTSANLSTSRSSGAVVQSSLSKKEERGIKLRVENLLTTTFSNLGVRRTPVATEDNPTS
ncbi:hypothetical protein PHYBLDRAFT_162905 [Phycomyces blakesleeanus NRRL 1555(-)]|uniref:Rap-GAP domain-containing protein n=1 Tax=Phycomyces blakesleeanus (strain ATCC 8743b / DSM 1359 / FGSC 10004 / NBRC 33097 / NRRL 1555) TaxID=763407 RepID=A0A162Q5F3_PHYB8|nr:hypothetical protein PHYBLDRAFT_162905 [Phycomyces blakesleeanus NRRL 1555(-)]OAD80256.1 hypothetical protein PHYBLDRAFT_162905 [Phycomyces blakesleeanus NRRL 1555(-)]|eukprot:XP_018298296.1 hypothetical protein PHYBLDRAFT_162905 [Phycomyces blakesleeanus NRRL 1555(-)]